MSRLKFTILSILFYLIIAFIWLLYEIWRFGEPAPDVFHSIIATVFSVSLAANVLLLRNFPKKRSRGGRM